MYQVTATRRRPQTFDELLGQEFVSATLKKSIEAGKIANAYLFSGPRGCGKTSTARILAKAINCEKGPTAVPCGVCDSCTHITAGSSFDVIEIDGASNTGVDDVRKLKDEILFPPNSSRYKVYIIDEVHMLSTNAFNALLKTIEEPPPYVVFIFATTELHKVPATIKSRCQQFNFRLVDIQTLHDALAAAAAELGIQADDEALYWIAREGTGSVRDSYTLFDQVAAFSGDHITLEKIQDKLGLTGIDAINDMVTACVHKNANEALSILHECLNNGISVEQFTIDCAKYFRSLLLVKHGITKESVLGQRASRFSVDVLQNWQATQIEQALAITLKLFKDINFSVNPVFEVELAVSRLAWLSDYVPPNELKRAYDQLKLVLTGKASPESLSDLNGAAVTHVNAAKDGPSVAAQTPVEKNEGAAQLQQSANISPAPQPENAASARAVSYDEPPLETYEGVADPFDTADSFTTPSPVQGNNDAESSKSAEHAVQPLGKPAATKTADLEPETVRVHSLSELKSNVIGELSKSAALLAHALSETQAWERNENALILKIDKSFQKITIEKNRSLVLETCEKYFGERGLTLEVVLVKPQVENRISSDEPPKKIKNLMRIFQARLVDTLALNETSSGGDNATGE